MKRSVVFGLLLAALGLGRGAGAQDSLMVTRLAHLTYSNIVVWGVAVSGSYAYVANQFAGLRIVDVTIPTAPVEVGRYDTPSEARGVAVFGSYAYVADFYNGLLVLNISNPAAPFLAGHCFTWGEMTAYNVAVSGFYAYVADRYTGLYIANIFDPTAPFEVGHYSTPGYTYDVAVSGSYAYVAADTAGLRIVGGTISPLYEVGHYSNIGHAYGVAVSDSYAYVVGNGLHILNVSNPASPFEVGSCYMPPYPQGVAISGAFAYVADGSNGLRIVNISNPAAPFEVGYYNPQTVCQALKVAVSGSQVYGADMFAFDIYSFIPPPTVVHLTPLNPPITIPANGGSFNFNISMQRTVAPQAPYAVWARIKNPNGTYTPPTLGPVTINTPVGITVTRQRTQNVPSSWAAGLYKYLAYSNPTVAYPAIDSSSFTWTKSATADAGGAWITEASCTGDPFPGEAEKPLITHNSELITSLNPNPFNPTTVASFELRVASHVRLKVYNTAGRLVSTLMEGWREAGTYEATFDGTGLAAGVYLVRLEVGNEVKVAKIVLLK